MRAGAMAARGGPELQVSIVNLLMVIVVVIIGTRVILFIFITASVLAQHGVTVSVCIWVVWARDGQETFETSPIIRRTPPCDGSAVLRAGACFDRHQRCWRLYGIGGADHWPS